MKLFDPLQGYRLAAGQSIVHFAFAIVMHLLPTLEGDYDLVQAINNLKAAHITGAILFPLVYVMDLEAKGIQYTCSSILKLIAMMYYFFAMFYAQSIYFQIDKAKELPIEQHVNFNWIEIEIVTFYAFIVGGIVFLFFASISKLYVYNNDTFNLYNRNDTDFMKYASFQYLWFSIEFTLGFTSAYILATFHQCNKKNNFTIILIILLLNQAIKLICLILLDFCKLNEERSNKQLMYKFILLCLSLFTYLYALINTLLISENDCIIVSEWIYSSAIIGVTSSLIFVLQYFMLKVKKQNQDTSKELESVENQQYSQMLLQREPLIKIAHQEQQQRVLDENNQKEEGEDEEEDGEENLQENQQLDKLQLEDDYYSLTFCSFLKDNNVVNNIYELNQNSAYETFFNCIFIFMIQGVLVFLVFTQIFSSDVSFVAVSYQLTIVRFICAILLHIQLLQEVRQSINMLKYISNNEDKFDDTTPPALTALMQFTIALFTEIINISLICTQETTMDILMNFLALGIIAQIDDYYAQSLGDLKIKLLIQEENLPKVYHSTKDFEDSTKQLERSIKGTILSYTYKFLRICYASYYYYFMAFTIIPLSYLAS